MDYRAAEHVTALKDRDRVLNFVTTLFFKRDGARLPAVLLLGRRGSGGTVLLDRIEDVSRENVPLARQRLKADPDAAPRTVVVATMRALQRKIRRIGKIPFPRLELGLIALDLDSSRSAEEMGAELRERLKRGGARIDQLQQQWAQRTETLLEDPRKQIAVMAASQLFSLALSGLNARQRKEPLAWYAMWYATAGLSSAGLTELNTLIELARWEATRVAAEDRLEQLPELSDEWLEAESEARQAERKVELTLCAALLADLSADFDKGNWRHGNRTANCLLLLDDADTGTGVRFLEVLKEARKLLRGVADPLIVVAAQSTRPTPELEVDLAPLPVNSDSLGYDTWLTESQKRDHQPFWYPIELTDLRSGDVADLTNSAVLGTTKYDARFVRAVTAGHPLAAVRLADVLRSASANPAFRPRDVFASQPGLADELLARLLPPDCQEAMIEAMAVASATLDLRPEECEHVFHELMRRGLGDVRADDVRTCLTETMWATAVPDSLSLDLHPLLRTLLRLRLARNPDRWDKVHTALAHYHSEILKTIADGTARREVTAERERYEKAAWYHQLALARPERPRVLAAVARDLDAGLDQRPDREWGRILEQEIATAPNRLRNPGAQGPFASILAGLSTAPANRGEVVGLLLAALWLHNDPLFDPSHRLAEVIAAEYRHLSERTGNSEWFRLRADYFADIADKWRKALP